MKTLRMGWLIALWMGVPSGISAGSPEQGLVDRGERILRELEDQAFGLRQTQDLDLRDIEMFAREFAETFFDSRLSGHQHRRALIETTNGIIIAFERHQSQFQPDNFDEMLRSLDQALQEKMREISQTKEFQESQREKKISAAIWGFFPLGATLGIFFVRFTYGAGKIVTNQFQKFWHERKHQKAIASGDQGRAEKCAQSIARVQSRINHTVRGMSGAGEGKKRLMKFLVLPSLAGVPLGFGMWYFYFEDRHEYDAQEDLLAREWDHFFERQAVR